MKSFFNWLLKSLLSLAALGTILVLWAYWGCHILGV